MRLNTAVRAEITRNAVKTLYERRVAMEEREAALAVRCWTNAFTPKEHTALQMVQDSSDKPMRWLKFEHRLTFNVAGQTVRLRAKEAHPVPQGYYTSCPLGNPITISQNKTLVNDVRAWQADSEELKSEISIAEKTLATLLKTVGSTETLFKAWPEGKKFYSAPPLTPASKISVPAVQMQALNTMLGLTT